MTESDSDIEDELSYFCNDDGENIINIVPDGCDLSDFDDEFIEDLETTSIHEEASPPLANRSINTKSKKNKGELKKELEFKPKTEDDTQVN